MTSFLAYKTTMEVGAYFFVLKTDLPAYTSSQHTQLVTDASRM